MEDHRRYEGATPGAIRVQRPLGERRALCEVAGDFSLPDYQPEIKRLLRVSATVQPPTHYIGGGSAEFSGRVDVCVLYAGPDDRLYCFADGCDYMFRVPLEAGVEVDLGEGLVCYADCEAESVIGRVAGPRKLGVKCRLRARVFTHATWVVDQKRRGSLPAGCGEERLLGQADTALCGWAQSDPLTLSDRVTLEGDDWRIISGDAEVAVSEAVCQGGRISVRGDAIVKLLLCREAEGARPETLWRRLPFETDIPCEAAAPGGEAAVSGVCTELNLSMEDSGSLLCEAEVVFDARCQRTETVFYTADWYATGCESRCEAGDLALPRPLRCINAALTLQDTPAPEELDLPPEAAVVDCAATATVDSVEAERGRYIVSGKCRYALICQIPDGEMTLREAELPFRYTAEGAAADGPVLYEGGARAVSAKCRADGHGRLSLEAELAISLRLWCQDTVQVVRATEVGEPLVRPAGRITLCYPAREDTLWSVGKRYHAPMEALAMANHLNDEKRADAPDSLAGVRVLVV